MKKILFFIVTLCLAVAAIAQSPERKTVFDGTYYLDQPLPGWETEVAKRIDLMGNIAWTPLVAMPKCFHTKDAMFDAGEQWHGIPYSTVSNYAGFVGRDVSFHTFLSAVNNVKGSMYTVNYHKPPYDHAKAGPFYGTVCTASANYAWGIPINLWTKRISAGHSNYLDDIGTEIDSLQLFDAFCWFQKTAGHIIIISGLGRDKDGKVQKIYTFEGTGPVNRLREFTLEQWHARYDKYEGRFYRYDHEKWGFSLPDFIEQEAEAVDWHFNPDFCPENGERLTYPQGKTIRFNIFNKKYKTIVLVKDGKEFKKKTLGGKNDVWFENLPEGLYSAFLVSKDGIRSQEQLFEVAQNSCEVRVEGARFIVEGLRNGVKPLGVYFTKNYSASRICRQTQDGGWEAVPTVPRSIDSVKVSLAGKYSAYWSKVVSTK